MGVWPHTHTIIHWHTHIIRTTQRQIWKYSFIKESKTVYTDWGLNTSRILNRFLCPDAAIISARAKYMLFFFSRIFIKEHQESGNHQTWARQNGRLRSLSRDKIGENIITCTRENVVLYMPSGRNASWWYYDETLQNTTAAFRKGFISY